MITRAQAEALLTLAESLEACERLGLKVEQESEDASICVGDVFHAPLFSVNGPGVRYVVKHLMPQKD